VAADPTRALNAVANALAELRSIVERSGETGDDSALSARLERWKRRTIEALHANVSDSDARGFAQLILRPNLVTMESMAEPLGRHHAYLTALAEELESQTLHAGSDATPAATQVATPRQHIFLSHAAADVALAAFFEEQVNAAIPCAEVFRTTRVGQIPSGLPWFEHITSHLKTARQYLVLLTPLSHSRPWVSFETGAAWMTGRKLVLVAAGGISPSSVAEPLRHLQVLSLEDSDQASQVFRDLGGNLSSPSSFTSRVKELAAIGKDTALRAEGWEQIEFDGGRYAWDGPLEELKEGYAMAVPDGLQEALEAVGARLTLGENDNFLKQAAKGYRPIWNIDARLVKHRLVGANTHILLVRPSPAAHS
jgi:hypothetical protein